MTPSLFDDGFSAFWSAYPRRDAKKDAQKAWSKLRPLPDLVAVILAAIERQKHSRQWRDGFIPLPATWIRGERWTDESVVSVLPWHRAEAERIRKLRMGRCYHDPTCESRDGCLTKMAEAVATGKTP